MYHEAEGHVFQTTALVHEAYLKLVSQKNAKWQNRAHFFAVSSQQMRRILVDAARSRLRQKRGSEVPVISLDDALQELAKLDPRRSRVVEMRYFDGMTVEEAAIVKGPDFLCQLEG
jgi:RNA polymerase sigma factor (TIGR02999 family)